MNTLEITKRAKDSKIFRLYAINRALEIPKESRKSVCATWSIVGSNKLYTKQAIRKEMRSRLMSLIFEYESTLNNYQLVIDRVQSENSLLIEQKRLLVKSNKRRLMRVKNTFLILIALLLVLCFFVLSFNTYKETKYVSKGKDSALVTEVNCFGFSRTYTETYK